MPPLVSRQSAENTWRQWLTVVEPKLMRDLASNWQTQVEQITIDDMRRAVAAGRVPQSLADRWQQSYAKFVNGPLKQRWQSAWDQANGTFARAAAGLGVAPGSDSFLEAMDAWAIDNSGSLIVGLTDAQRDAVNNIIRWHAVNDPVSATELARSVSQVVPLTPRDAASVAAYRAGLIKSGAKPREIERLAGTFARRKQAIRARRIARTELASAHNAGAVNTVRAAIADGDIDPNATKEWLTAEDERVCPICGPLNETSMPLEDDFVNDAWSATHPPIHPNCRCTLVFDVDAAGDSQKPEEKPPADEEEDLVLNDEDFDSFIDDEYTKYRDEYSYPEALPNGKRFDPATMVDEMAAPGPVGKAEMSWNQRELDRSARMRGQLTSLIGEFGIVSNDYQHSTRSGFDRLRADGGSSADYRMCDRYWLMRRSRMSKNTLGFHSADGGIHTGSKRFDAARRFMQRRRDGRGYSGDEAAAFKTLVHETLHTAGNIGGRLKYNAKHWRALEEFTTESAARGIMRRMFGVQPDTMPANGYSNMLSRMAGNLIDVAGKDGTRLERDRAAALLERACIRWKRKRAGAPEDMPTSLRRIIDGLDTSLNNKQKSDLIYEWERTLSRGAVQ